MGGRDVDVTKRKGKDIIQAEPARKNMREYMKIER